MADYTHYSELDPEWIEFAKTFRPAEQSGDLTIAKKVFNANRAALFQEVLGHIGEPLRSMRIPIVESQC